MICPLQLNPALHTPPLRRLHRHLGEAGRCVPPVPAVQPAAGGGRRLLLPAVPQRPRYRCHHHQLPIALELACGRGPALAADAPLTHSRSPLAAVPCADAVPGLHGLQGSGSYLSLDVDGRVIRVESFAKFMAPGAGRGGPRHVCLWELAGQLCCCAAVLTGAAVAAHIVVQACGWAGSQHTPRSSTSSQ